MRVTETDPTKLKIALRQLYAERTRVMSEHRTFPFRVVVGRDRGILRMRDDLEKLIQTVESALGVSEQ